jgi:hypothetical protein
MGELVGCVPCRVEVGEIEGRVRMLSLTNDAAQGACCEVGAGEKFNLLLG